jgi:hypothetical protein
MHASQQSRGGLVEMFAFLFMFAGCVPSPDRARPVATAEQAGQIAAQHLFSLGQDTTCCTLRVRPDHPISWDTIQAGNRYAGWPVEDSSSFGKLVRDHLSGKIFWRCFSVDTVGATDNTRLVTDATNAEVYIEANTGVVLLTLPQDFYKSTGSSH